VIAIMTKRPAAVLALAFGFVVVSVTLVNGQQQLREHEGDTPAVQQQKVAPTSPLGTTACHPAQVPVGADTVTRPAQVPTGGDTVTRPVCP
jgi:hypothetical protein